MQLEMPTKRDKRSKSELTKRGDRVKWEWERDELLRVLRANKFNLTHTARDLEMGTPTAVLHAIDRYELRAEYESHKAGK